MIYVFEGLVEYFGAPDLGAFVPNLGAGFREVGESCVIEFEGVETQLILKIPDTRRVGGGMGEG